MLFDSRASCFTKSTNAPGHISKKFNGVVIQMRCISGSRRRTGTNGLTGPATYFPAVEFSESSSGPIFLSLLEKNTYPLPPFETHTLNIHKFTPLNLNQSVLFIFCSGFRSGWIFTMNPVISSFLFTPDYIFASGDNFCYRNAIITTAIFYLINSVLQALSPRLS